MKTETPKTKKVPAVVQPLLVHHLKRNLNPDYIIRVTRLSVMPPNQPLFSEQCTHITIADEAAGEYLEIEQQSMSVDIKPQTISVTAKEWPMIKEAVETLIAEILGPNKVP